MKTLRHGWHYTSGVLVAVLLLAAWAFLAPPADAAGTFVPGELQRQVYTNLPGGRIADLVNAAKFPDHPDLVSVVTSFETPSDSGEQYGERLTGFLVPPVTGDYVFYLASDDQGVLFLSPDTNPANKVQIAIESGWNAPRSWTGTGGGRTNSANISSPIYLVAGQKYYVEALHKEALGGDSFGVAWQMPGQLPPANGSPPISGQFLGREVSLPDLSFQLAFFSGNGPSAGSNVFFRNYTTAGPQPGAALLPGMRLVPDAGQRYYYAADTRGVLKVDSQTGTAEAMAVGPGVPELSWPMGMAFDSSRNRALLASLGGEGFLYAYAPGSSQWSLVASMQNRDVDSIVYHASQDALYALEVYRTNPFGPRLYRFSAAGVYQSEFQLPPIPFDVGVASHQSELVSVGDYLFLLIGPDPVFSNSTVAREARMYLINPRSSQVWLTYREVIPPAVAPVISWPAAAPITYGTPLGENQLNAAASVAGQFAYDPPAGTLLSAGAGQVLSVTFTPSDTANYTVVTASQTIDVRPAPLTVTADNKTKRQGLPNPPLTATCSGFVAGDSPASLDTPVILATTATAASPAGTYPISASGASDPNYSITHVNGTLTVTPLSPGPGSLDPTFDPGAGGQFAGLAQGPVNLTAVAPQADGKLLIAGQFVGVDGRLRANLARLNPDGSLDPAFHPSVVFSRDAQLKLALRANGQILVADGSKLVCLNPDGSPDTQFSQTSAALCCNLAVQPDGKILVAGGTYTSWYIDRLNADGTRDISFQRYYPPVMVRALALQPDGKILGVGGFASGRLTRLNPDGTPDSGFSAPITDDIDALALQPDGKILIGGYLQKTGSFDRYGVARLNSNGSLDPTFALGLVSVDPRVIVYALAVQADGSILIGGVHPHRTAYSWDYGAGYLLLLKLRSDGAEDTSFTAQLGNLIRTQYASVRALAIQSNGLIYAAGNMADCGVVRVSPSGLVDAGFRPNVQGQPGQVDAVAVRPNGKALVVGRFSTVAGTPRPGLALLNADGSLDLNFIPALPAGYRATACAAQADDKVVVATGMEPYLAGELLRLNPDGTRDVSFTPRLQLSDGQARIWQVLIQPDGRILVAGDFDVVNDTSARSFARLNADGSLDPSFDSHGGISVPYSGYAFVNALVLQPDGKLLVGGKFQEINDTGFSLLARLNPDGSVDTSFETRWLTESEHSFYEVRSLAWQPDGKVLVGAHVAVDRTPQPALLRLNADGSLDSSFHLGGPTTAAAEVADVNAISCQTDGKILVGGVFDSFDGQPQPNLVRLLPDGNLDPSFQVLWDNTAAGIAAWEIGQVSALALQPDNKVLVGGGFSSIEWQPRWGIARLLTVPLPPVPATPGDCRMPAVAASENLYLIAWADQRNAQTNDWDIYAARVTADGRLLDPGGIAVCALPYLQQFPRVASDGHDFLVVWEDARALAAGGPAGVTNYDVYGARITADGRVLDLNGIPISRALASQSKPSVAWNGASYLVVWADARSSSNTQSALDIYGARLSPAGTVLDPAGLPICTALNQQSWPEVAAWNGDFFVAWTDLGQVPNGIYGTRVTGAGSVVHPDGFPLTSRPASFTPGLAANPAGYLMLWPNNPFSGRIGCDVRALRIAPSGENVLADLGVLRQTTNFLTTADVAASSNECLAVWMDDRAGPGVVKVWGARIGPSGMVASNGLEIATMAAPRFWNAPAVASLQGDYLVAWVGPQAGDSALTDIFATRVSHDGLVRDRDGILISGPQVSPQLEITVPPFSQTRFTGQSASFAVELGGSPPFTYQWCFNASPIAGAAGPTLALTSLQTSNAGLYSVVVANASGAVTSSPALLTILPAPGGPGSLDVTFDPTAGGQLIGPAQVQGVVKSLASQPDGKLLLGGSFVGVNGRARNNIARLQRDGRLDESFSPGFGTDGYVDDVVVQPDGRILLVGAFARVNGAPRQGLARLHPDGSLDGSFHPTVGGYPPTCLALQSDGKILIGGSFTNVCDLPRRALARLNPDGTLDASFDAAAVITASGPGISALALQADGKVLIAGQFAAAYDRPLARLNPDGSPDSSFLVPQIRESSTVGWVFSLALEQSGRILIGGRFLSVNGTGREGLARLNVDGSLDSTFLAGSLADDKDVSKVVVQPDGKVLIGGSFLGVGGSVRRGLARLLPNGAVDLSFDPSNAVYDNTAPWVNDLLLDAAGRLVVASGLSGQWNRSPHPLCRLNPNGALDGGFAIPVILQSGSVAKVAVQADGELLVLPFQAGTSINGLPCGPLARLLPDGIRDSSFTSPIVGGSATCVLVQPDGKILLGGDSFLLADQTRLLGLIRLNSDGSLDPSFQTESGDYAVKVYSLALQPDGRILVNGNFASIRGAGHSFVVRLNPNGSLDSSFQLDPQLNPNVGEFDPPINCVAVQPDGKLLIGGWFDDMVPRLVRLNPNGSLDRDLLTPSQTGGVEQIIVQPDGKLLLAGRFSFFGESQWECVVRIQADGTLDTVFPSAFNWVNSLALQPDGKVLATVVGEPVSLLRYNANGTVDSTFAPEIKYGFGDPTLMSVVLQPDGQVVVAGSFSSVSGIPCYGLARLNNDLVVPLSFVTRQLPGQHGSLGSTVRLLAQPPGAIAVYALQDQPPAAWLVTNISHGGVFDALTGKVKFGPFFDSDARTLSYDILPPPGFVGVGLFAGVASADGASSPIVGDDRLVITSLHPADYSPADWAMRLDKVTAYAAAWRTGGVWMLPPNPIPIDYVSRAAALWRGGETYVLDCSAGAPPLCWVNASPLPHIQAMNSGDRISVLRRAPKGYLAGEGFEVTIEVSALSSTLAYAVEESFPAGWQIQNISHGGAIDPLHRQIKWGPFCDSTPRTLRYQMVPPAAASGPISFAGNASFDGAASPVGGPAFIGSASRLTWTPQPEKGRWVLQLKGDRDARYLVETSTNLVQWTALTTVTNSLGQVEIPAPVPSQFPQQYYRARLITPP